MRRRRQLLNEIVDYQVRMWNRNQLIGEQDAEITRLRREIKDLGHDLDKARADLEVVAAEREYWQGKAANP